MSAEGFFFNRRQENPPGLYLVAKVGAEGGALDLTPEIGERRVITIETETAADGSLHIHSITIRIDA